MKNTVFIPTVAEFPGDILASLEVSRLLKEAGYNGGFMIVIRCGLEGVTGNKVGKQYQNLSEHASSYPRETPIITILSNIPICEIDFLHETTNALAHVKLGIEFAKGLPIGGRKIVTFHLNSLITEEEFLSHKASEWREIFSSQVAPALREAGQCASNNGVEVKVETVPVPEFGDSISAKTNRPYRGVLLRDLRNPFYLTDEWGFSELHDCGLGVCMDLCHSRTIYKMARLPQGKTLGILHKEDVEALRRRSLMNDVMALNDSDIVHFNDGSGLYMPDGGSFSEGVQLGKGDIEELSSILSLLNRRRIPFVLELDEQDFKNRTVTKEGIRILKTWS